MYVVSGAAHDHDDAGRYRGRPRTVRLVRGHEEQGVDEQVAETDRVVIEAEPHADYRSERVREVAGDDSPPWESLRGEDGVVPGEYKRHPRDVPQLHPALHVQIAHGDCDEHHGDALLGEPYLPSGEGAHRWRYARPDIEADQKADPQPYPHPARAGDGSRCRGRRRTSGSAGR